MVITAKYAGKCRKCGGHINVGDQIDWERGRGATHITCPDTENGQCEATADESAELLYRIGGGSGYGCSGWSQGDVISRPSGARYADYPEYLYVVHASRTYYREEGMSFGVGDESGYTYYAECREATADESAELRDRHETDMRRAAARTELTAIRNDIQDRGDRPDDADPQGDRLIDTQNIHGGGDWYVIGDDRIWYVRNNGMDGDSWANNNVRTGGAGAIGWCVPADTDLAARIRAIAEILA